MLQPLLRRTWAPRGSRPALDVSQRHDRLSVVGALSLAPQRCRLGFYFHVQPRNIVTADVVAFVRQLRRHLPGPLTLVWDRWSVHRAAARQLLQRSSRRLRIEYLPAYAPDLNPVEGAWSHTKGNPLANHNAHGITELDDVVQEALCDLHDTPRLLRSFFQLAQLDTG